MIPDSEPTDAPRQNTWLQQAQQQWRSMISWTSPLQASQSLQPQPQRKPSVLTMHNSHSNDPWGDVLSEKPSHCTRIHVQNVNGFNLDRCGGQFDHYCATHKEIANTSPQRPVQHCSATLGAIKTHIWHFANPLLITL
jgi:hypothetical protein